MQFSSITTTGRTSPVRPNLPVRYSSWGSRTEAEKSAGLLGEFNLALEQPRCRQMAGYDAEEPARRVRPMHRRPAGIREGLLLRPMDRTASRRAMNVRVIRSWRRRRRRSCRDRAGILVVCSFRRRLPFRWRLYRAFGRPVRPRCHRTLAEHERQRCAWKAAQSFGPLTNRRDDGVGWLRQTERVRATGRSCRPGARPEGVRRREDGDALVVARPERLARSSGELLKIADALIKRGCGLVVLAGLRWTSHGYSREPILGADADRACGSVAAWERAYQREPSGRPASSGRERLSLRSMSEAVGERSRLARPWRWREIDFGPTTIARVLRIHRDTVYTYLPKTIVSRASRSANPSSRWTRERSKPSSLPAWVRPGSPRRSGALRRASGGWAMKRPGGARRALDNRQEKWL